MAQRQGEAKKTMSDGSNQMNTKTRATGHRENMLTARLGNSRRALIAATGGAMLAGCWTNVSAQDSSADARPLEESIDVIVVTSSRIQQSGFAAPTPTTVLDTDAIRDLGVTNIGQLTYELPAFIGTESPSNSAVRSGGGGNAFNLRGLGSNRTQFLVNSRRHVHSSPRGRTDNNVIPSAIIERVEVVTGGASAAWGSDAVAGVVNVILKEELDGAESEIQMGRSSHGDNEEFKVALAYGSQFADGRGKFIVAGEYQDNDGVLRQGDRDWGREEWWVINNPNFTPTNGQYANLTVTQGRTNNATYGGLIVNGVLAGTQFLPGGVAAPYDSGLFPVGGQGTVGGDGVHLSADLNILVPIERYAAFSRASYNLTDDLELYVEASIGESKADYTLVNNSNFGNLTIAADNAFLPAALRTTLANAGQTSFRMGRVHRDFGTIREDNVNRLRRGVIGLEGRLGGDWQWDAYYQYGHNRETLIEGPTIINANFALATDAVLDANGQAACRSTLTNPTNGCVPINLFGDGSPSATAIDYVTGERDEETTFKHHNAALSVQGTLFSVPAGAVPVAAGFEYNKETLDRSVDPISQTNGFAIGNPKDFDGAISVNEVFAEIAVPLLADVPLVKSLRVDVADRYVDYSTTGGSNTWKAGLSWEMTDQVRIRVARSRDIRAPSAFELFSFGGLQFVTLFDTVNGRPAPSLVRQVNSPSPGLEPEEADTWTYGIVLKPSWLPRFRLSVDRYDIDISGAIGSVPAQARVDRCAGGNQAFCDTIIRDGAGEIVEIQAGVINFQHVRAKGYDIEAVYSVPFLAGELSLRGLANYAEDLITDDGITAVDQAGAVAWTTATTPDWRANGSIGYDIGAFGVLTNIRYVGGGKYADNVAANVRDVQQFSGRTYVDLAVSYDFGQGGGPTAQVFARVNNAFDKDPPIITEGFPGAPLTNYTLYDGIGRTFLAGFRFNY
jgi:iron complex outermembrane receptor protein